MRRSTVPGTYRILSISFSAKARLARRLLPITWTSIGAGRPKFRIWLTMSTGRK